MGMTELLATKLTSIFVTALKYLFNGSKAWAIYYENNKFSIIRSNEESKLTACEMNEVNFNSNLKKLFLNPNQSGYYEGDIK